MTYKRLEIEEFGRLTIRSGDLDPVYIALNKMELDEAHRARWLLAYWCLYHPGLASYLSDWDDDDFWIRLKAAAVNETECPVGGRWPRAAERRHWRGRNAIASFKSLSEFGSPLDFVEYLSSPRAQDETLKGELIPYRLIEARARQFVGFGPWIAFKIGDMLERLEIAPIDFDQASCFMFKDPRKAALTLFRKRAGLSDDVRIKDEQAAIDKVVAYLVEHFKDESAPPIHDRLIGFQEVETVLCKWKSHVNGHYPLYNDLDEIRKGAEPWEKVSTTAKSFNHFLPLSPRGDKG